MSDRIERIRTFLEQSPDDCFLNHALALEYVKAGDEQEALKLFEKNLAFDPGYIATYYHLGKLLEKLGEQERAISIYEKGMEQARAAGDGHSYNELQAAHEDLAY